MRSIGFVPLRSISRPSVVRLLGALLSVLILGNSVAQAAGQPGPAPGPDQWKQKLNERGVGKWVAVKRTNVSGTVGGVLTAIHDDSFEVTPNGAQRITIQYSQVSLIRNRMSHQEKVWIWVTVGAIWVLLGVASART